MADILKTSTPAAQADTNTAAGRKAGFRVVVLGGYGLFGGRIVRELSHDAGLDLFVAGRSRASAERFIATIEAPRACAQAIALDTESPDFAAHLHNLAPQLVIDTAGPFQQRRGSGSDHNGEIQATYRVASAALAAGAHVIDLADSRDYVCGIDTLDAQAQAAQRWVISGASSVPGLHAAVIEAFRGRFAEMDTVSSAIAPGNRTPRGWATMLAILSYCGKPYRILQEGAWRTVYGWQSLRRCHLHGLGTRWLAHCDVPDLDVLPARYPGLHSVDFRAGLELRRMHLGLWLATWGVRIGLIRDLRRFAKPLYRLSQRWQDIGSDTGFMRVSLGGRGHDGRRQQLDWTLIARNGDGPQIPATAAVVLTRKLANDALPGAGAKPCLDFFTLEEFLATLDGFAMDTRTEIVHTP
jgi:saccharopine dehydrogenase-like NADP-dependent oxidoreductase